MKLSLAIRLGAMLRPQGKNNEAMIWWVGERPTCALGAAMHALNLKNESVIRQDAWITNSIYPLIVARYEWIDTLKVQCPACTDSRRVIATIYSLNDTHRWTRERIADWVATVEPQDTAEPEHTIVEIMEEQLA